MERPTLRSNDSATFDTPPMWRRVSGAAPVNSDEQLCTLFNYVRTEDAACVIIITETGDFIELE